LFPELLKEKRLARSVVFTKNKNMKEHIEKEDKFVQKYNIQVDQ